MSPAYKTFDHTSDFGLEIKADTLEELYQSAACALAELMFKGPRDGEVSWQPVELTGASYEDLLVALLNEVIFQAEAESQLTVALTVDHIDPGRFAGRLGLIPLTTGHQPEHVVKAATYHQASVEERGKGFMARVVLDV